MQLLKDYFNSISPLSEETWEEIAPLFKKQSLPAQALFAKPNETARKIAFLESGCVRAFFTNSEGKEYNKQFFTSPGIIGAYTSLLTGNKNLIPQQALTDCVIWMADYNRLKGYFDHFHDLERLARKIAEHYFLEKEKKELEIVLKDATERYLIFQKEFPKLELTIPQYHIASYLGISATQLSRIRNQLSRR